MKKIDISGPTNDSYISELQIECSDNVYKTLSVALKNPDFNKGWNENKIKNMEETMNDYKISQYSLKEIIDSLYEDYIDISKSIPYDKFRGDLDIESQKSKYINYCKGDIFNKLLIITNIFRTTHPFIY